MLWEQKKDCRHSNLIAEAIRRDEAEAVLKCLHFKDNTKMDGDTYFKVRPILTNLNKAAKYNIGAGAFSVDEVMIPYFGRHGMKQYIHGNPVCYGYKVCKMVDLSIFFIRIRIRGSGYENSDPDLDLDPT